MLFRSSVARPSCPTLWPPTPRPRGLGPRCPTTPWPGTTPFSTSPSSRWSTTPASGSPPSAEGGRQNRKRNNVQERAKSLLLKGGAPVRKLGRRIAFWRSQNMRSKHSFAILIHFVCSASPNTILSQPSADGSFHWISVSGFAAYGYRVPLAGKRSLVAYGRDGGRRDGGGDRYGFFASEQRTEASFLTAAQ